MEPLGASGMIHRGLIAHAAASSWPLALYPLLRPLEVAGLGQLRGAPRGRARGVH
jgi:hypothetical protein